MNKPVVERKRDARGKQLKIAEVEKCMKNQNRPLHRMMLSPTPSTPTPVEQIKTGLQGIAKIHQARARRAKVFKAIIGLIVLIVAIMVAARLRAATRYSVLTATGTTSAEAIFPASEQAQLRIVGAMATSDKSASVLSFTTGTTPYTVAQTNTATTNAVLTSVTGLASNDVVVLQKINGVTVSGIVWGTSNGTNLILTAAFSSAPGAGDQVYKMGTAKTLKVGAAAVNLQGQAFFIGAQGRPVRCVLDGTSACSIDCLSATAD